MAGGDELEWMHKLFAIPISPVSWEILVERSRDTNLIPQERKQGYLEAVQFLKSEMGNGFFMNCGLDHPVRMKLTSPALLEDLLYFVDTLKKLKSENSNYQLLLSKLRPRDECRNEGAFFADIAGDFLSGNFDVEFLNEAPPLKTPDIKITERETLECFYIEVSRVDDSEDRSRADQEHRKLSGVLMLYGYDLLRSFKQLRHINDDAMDLVIEKIKSLKDEAFEKKSLITYKDEYIDVILAHPDRADEFNTWCCINNRQLNEVSGLTIDYNDTRRILQQDRIRKKVKQLPPEGTGLLYMPIHFLYFFTMDKPQTMMLLAEEIQKYANLLGMVLYADLAQSLPEKNVSIGRHSLSIKFKNGILRHKLFVYNEAYKGSFQGKTIDKILSCINDEKL